MKRALSSIAALAFLAVFPSSATAALVAHYTFTNSSFESTVFSGYSASTLTETGFASVSTTGNAPGSGAARAITLNQIGDTFGPAFYQFTVTTNPTGGTLNLGQLSFVYNTSGGGTGVASRYQVQYNDPSLGSDYQVLYTSPVTQGTTKLTAIVDLSSPAFDNLASGINFRIYVADSGATDSGVSLRIDDIMVDTVPEPSGALLGLISLGGFLLRRRR